jgi:hypothetical protein
MYQIDLGTKYLHFCGNSKEDGILGISLGYKGKYCNIVTSFFFVQLLMGKIYGMGQSIWDYVQGENYHNCDLLALEKKSLSELIP